MKPFKFRASAISKIMTEAKTKGEPLSVGAKTEIESIAKQLVYGYTKEVSSKQMEKGILVEDKSIELYNSVFFTDYVKNTERRTNDWVTGECDIFTGSKVIDIKSPWSVETFPALAGTGADKDYEWQLRTYMWLWDVPEAEIAYCLVSTPPELIGYESEQMHYVEEIEPLLRVTRVQYERDKELEARMRFKVESANAYLDQIVKQIADEHAG